LLLGIHLVGLSEDVAAFFGIVVLVELGLRQGVQAHLHHHLLLLLLDMLAARATVHHHQGRVGRHGALEVHRCAYLAVPPSEGPRVGALLLLVLFHHHVGALPGGGVFHVGVVQTLIELEQLLLLLQEEVILLLDLHR
jgi:hypothetical protein